MAAGRRGSARKKSEELLNCNGAHMFMIKLRTAGSAKNQRPRYVGNSIRPRLAVRAQVICTAVAVLS